MGTLVLIAVGCASTGRAQATRPFGDNRGGWVASDGGIGPHGAYVGCIDGRRWVVASDIRNRTKHTVTLMGSPTVKLDPFATRVAISFELEPQSNASSDEAPAVPRSMNWSTRKPRPLAVPAGRVAWIKSSILLSHCALLHHPWSRTASDGIRLDYRAGSDKGSEVLSSVAIALTRDPTHP